MTRTEKTGRPLERAAALVLAGLAFAGLAFAGLAVAVCPPAFAASTSTATLQAGLVPERLGAGTTIEFSLTITPPAGGFPPALRAIDLRYPANLGIATSGLGTSTCRARDLKALGPPGCPTNSVMGYGTGLVEVPFGGSQTLYERTRATTFMAPLHQGHLGLLFYADGEDPVSAQFIFPATVLPAQVPFGGDLSTTLPLIESVPEAPNVALLALTMTLGPSRVTYYEYAKHKKIPYHPRGIHLPPRCPPHGFQFAVALAFDDGTHAEAQATVPCPAAPGRP